MHVRNVLGCHAGGQEVGRCCTRGESEASVVHRQGSTQARDPSWLWNPGQTSPVAQNKGISGPTKKDSCHPKNFSKKSLQHEIEKARKKSTIRIYDFQHIQHGSFDNGSNFPIFENLWDWIFCKIFNLLSTYVCRWLFRVGLHLGGCRGLSLWFTDLRGDRGCTWNTSRNTHVIIRPHVQKVRFLFLF